MCHQSIGLIGAELERAGMSTVGLTVCPEITRKVGPPRSLSLSYPFGFPLGEPENPALQRRILLAALELLEHPGPPPLMVEEPGKARS